MSVVLDARDRIVAALRATRLARVYDQPDASVETPAVVVYPPDLTWLMSGSAPTDATFTVAILVAQDDRYVRNVVELTEALVTAVDALPGVVVKSATGGRYVAGTAELPAYLVTIEVSL